jgi:hypothetical protein
MPENVNGTDFYRATSAFGEDMLRVFNRGITKL